MVSGDRPRAPREVSRRGLLRGVGATLAAGGALLASGCGASGSPAATTATTPLAPAQSARDLTLLAAALELERRTVAAYVACIPLLDHDDGKLARQLLSQELAHTGELISLIKAEGGHARPKANSYAIGAAADAGSALALLRGFEQLLIRHYLSMIGQLASPASRAGVGSILAADSQHALVLRQVVGAPAIAAALVS